MDRRSFLRTSGALAAAGAGGLEALGRVGAQHSPHLATACQLFGHAAADLVPSLTRLSGSLGVITGNPVIISDIVPDWPRILYGPRGSIRRTLHMPRGALAARWRPRRNLLLDRPRQGALQVVPVGRRYQ